MVDYSETIEVYDIKVGIHMQRSVLVPYAFVWENVYMVDYSETIEVHDIKVGIW